MAKKHDEDLSCYVTLEAILSDVLDRYIITAEMPDKVKHIITSVPRYGKRLKVVKPGAILQFNKKER